MDKKKPFHVDPYALVFALIVVAGVCVHLITPGTLADGVYTPLPKNELTFSSLFDLFLAVPMGIQSCAGLIAILLVCTGTIEVLKRTGAVDAGISALLRRYGSRSGTTLLAIIGVATSALGGFLGWADTLFAFIPLVSAVVLALGYDAITAVALIGGCSICGFTAGPTNLYTVGICNSTLQSLGMLSADSGLFAGMGFRIGLWCVYTAIAVTYTVIYAERVRRDPARSLLHGTADTQSAPPPADAPPFTVRHLAALLCLLVAMVASVVGMQASFGGEKWGQDHMAAAFLVAGILAGVIGRLRVSQITQAFVDGARGSIGAGLILGLARGVFWILEKGSVNATVAYQMSRLLEGLPPLAAAIGIAVLVTLINALIPSGSGKGALLSPLLLPIAQDLGLGAQTAILAFQLGSGPTYLWWVTIGPLYVCLEYGKVPLKPWLKFFTPLVALIYLAGFAALAVAVAIGY